MMPTMPTSASCGLLEWTRIIYFFLWNSTPYNIDYKLHGIVTRYLLFGNK